MIFVYKSVSEYLTSSGNPVNSSTSGSLNKSPGFSSSVPVMLVSLLHHLSRYETEQAKETARLQRELRDTKDALEVLKKAISILGKWQKQCIRQPKNLYGSVK
jgi:hypothetical protein